MFCGQCGTNNDNTNKFCIECGQKLQQTNLSNLNNDTEQDNTKDKIVVSNPTPLQTSADNANVSNPTPLHSSIPEKTIEESLKTFITKEQQGQPLFDTGCLFDKKYELRAFIGRGGMGDVYEAFDRTQGISAAIKVMLPSLLSNDEAVKRFVNEAKIAKQLTHKNIAKAIDSGQFEGINYIAMEFIRGQTLRQWIDKKASDADIDEILEIMIQICKGLEFAHQITVHRDIKPENIMLDENNIVKIMDFGIAKSLSLVQMTKTTSSMGTAYYMAPEQTIGAGAVDEKADIFSVGVIFYEMLTGRIPIGNFRIPTSTKKLITGGIGQILKKMLEPKPLDRFQSAQYLRQALVEEAKEIKKIKLEQKIFNVSNIKNIPDLGVLKNVKSIEKPIKEKDYSILKWGIGTVLLSCIIFLFWIGYDNYIKKDKVDEVFLSRIEKGKKYLIPSDLQAFSSEIDEITGLPLKVKAKISGIELNLIPGGYFNLGSNDGDEDEKPVRRVFINPFYMGKYEINNRQYKMFVDESGSSAPVNVFGEDSEYTLWNDKHVSFELWKYPVINITRYEAMAFANWLCAKENVKLGIYRLPTEAEWEKAAKSRNNYKYPWGNDEPDKRLLNFNKTWEGAFTLTKTGSYPPNEYGIYDLAGNVWEWCIDRYDKDFYRLCSKKNPVNLDKGEQYILRGGCWASYPFLLRSSNRYSNDPDVRYFYNGFRIVRFLE